MKCDDTIIVRVPKELKEQFHEWCKENDYTMNKYLRDCMRNVIIKEEEEND